MDYDAEMWGLLRWHYKHSLLNRWGSTELQAQLRPPNQTFELADENVCGVADMDMYFMGMLETPSPSSACVEDL